MPITINGSGTLTGLSTGGLPDGSVNNADLAANAVSTSKILNGAVTLAKLGTDEQLGLCKAWVNFDGTGTVAIRASYNVSSITDNGTGDYTVTFTTALADANYSAVQGGVSGMLNINNTRTTTSFRVATTTGASGSQGVLADQSSVDVAIFR